MAKVEFNFTGHKASLYQFFSQIEGALKPQAMEDAVPWNYWKSNHKQ